MANDNGHSEPATLQEVRGILREVARSQQETDRRMQETDRRMQETDRHMQETDRRMRETDRHLRKLDDLFNGQWGKLMETLVEGDLIKLLGERGIAVDHTMTNVKKEYGGRRWELDILAVNGDEVVVVEVKTTLKVRHVDHLIGLLRDLPDLMREYADCLLYGAAAYLKADESSAAYAERNGLFVIRATGSGASITNPPDFTPRRFGRSAPTASRAR